MATVTKPIALDESLNTTETPSRNVADVLAEELQNIASAIGGGGGQGGHTIEGADGTALSQEPTLQFADADATDDAVNEKTVVNVVRKRTQAQYDAMSAADKAKGIIEINDANAKPLFDTQVRHGDSTVNDLLNRIGYLSGLRFKNLGTSFTAEQQAKLASGDLTDFWNGDYWVINGITWRIVDNTGWARRRGDTEFDSPSLVVMPDTCLIPAEAYLIDDNDNSGRGYGECAYRTRTDAKGRSACKSIFESAFGASHIASHREMMSTERGTHGSTRFGWKDADVELPSEVNIYGHSVWGTGNGYQVDAYAPSGNIGDRWGQFKLFELAPYMAINRNINFWMRDICSATWFAGFDNSGFAAYATPSTPVGIRPYAIII